MAPGFKAERGRGGCAERVAKDSKRKGAIELEEMEARRAGAAQEVAGAQGKHGEHSTAAGEQNRLVQECNAVDPQMSRSPVQRLAASRC
eukprot:280164-Hanusia_phi.AAC.3